MRHGWIAPEVRRQLNEWAVQQRAHQQVDDPLADEAPEVLDQETFFTTGVASKEGGPVRPFLLLEIQEPAAGAPIRDHEAFPQLLLDSLHTLGFAAVNGSLGTCPELNSWLLEVERLQRDRIAVRCSAPRRDYPFATGVASVDQRWTGLVRSDEAVTVLVGPRVTAGTSGKDARATAVTWAALEGLLAGARIPAVSYDRWAGRAERALRPRRRWRR